jgi:diguanylate cyclase (GGDEF)-like protein
MPSPLDLLARVPLFRDLSPDDLAEIAATSSVQSFARDEHIFDIGEPGRSLFIITDGLVQVHHPHRDGQFELAQFGPGDFFGEMALLDDAPRSATARALGEVEALVLDKVQFRKLLGERPDVGLKLLQTLSTRIRHADEQINGLTNKAVRDPLTGLLNRTAFNDRLDEEVARSRRYDGSFSLILLDFARFHDINASFGRELGDRILRWFGRLLVEHTRASDVPFRFEHDVFAILCPWTVGAYASAVADRLSRLAGEARPPVEAAVTLTVCGGTATCPTDAQDAQALYQSAQRALVAAKAAR